MEYPRFKRENVNFLLSLGGLGDNICRFPALRYIKDKHPHVDPQVYVMDFCYDLATHLLPDVTIRKFSDNRFYDANLPARSTGVGWFTNLKTDMVQHAFALLANEIPPIEYQNYLQLNLKRISVNKFKLPKRYACITTGFTSKVREFKSEYINEVIRYIKSKNIDIIFLGQHQSDAGVKGHEVVGTFKEEIDYSQGLNLINNTTLLEAGKIIANSEFILGVDNGLLHLAGCTQVPIVFGFTTVSKEHRLPVRNNIKGWNVFPVEPPESLGCRFCQSKWDLQFEIDFRNCYYQDKGIYKEIECVNQLTTDRWIEQLEKIL